MTDRTLFLGMAAVLALAGIAPSWHALRCDKGAVAQALLSGNETRLEQGPHDLGRHPKPRAKSAGPQVTLDNNRIHFKVRLAAAHSNAAKLESKVRRGQGACPSGGVGGLSPPQGALPCRT
jgi:hypothetical protein